MVDLLLSCLSWLLLEVDRKLCFWLSLIDLTHFLSDANASIISFNILSVSDLLTVALSFSVGLTNPDVPAFSCQRSEIHVTQQHDVLCHSDLSDVPVYF